MMRAVCYARVSSQAQRERDTIASQLTALPAFVERQGWKLVKPADHYVDDGRTAKAGHLEQREAFTRLLKDAAAHQFDVVAVIDLDRLTRSEDLTERGSVLGAFQRAGVQIAVASSGQVLDLSSSMGDLYSSLQAFFAAEENRKRRERSVRGKIEAARRGRKTGGTTLFGYDFDPASGAWSVNQEQAAIIQRTFRRAGTGVSAVQLARDLDAAGVRRLRGAAWTFGRVCSMLHNPAYRGEYRAHKRCGIMAAIPPIVTPEEWNAAQSGLAARRKYTGPQCRRVSLCEGIARCALCGAKIYINASSDGRYYVCGRRMRPGREERCGLPYLRIDRVDAAVWELVRAQLDNPELLERAAAKADRKPARDWTAELASCEKKLARMARAESEILDRFGRGGITSAAMDRHLATADRERKQLERDRDVARQHVAAASRGKAERDGLRAAIEAIRGKVNEATPEGRRDLVRRVVPGTDGHVVEMTRDGVRVHGILPPVNPSRWTDGRHDILFTSRAGVTLPRIGRPPKRALEGGSAPGRRPSVTKA